MPHRKTRDTEPMDRILLWAVQSQHQSRSINDDHPILRKEVEAAVQVLKKEKLAEVDKIPAELVQAGGEDVITALRQSATISGRLESSQIHGPSPPEGRPGMSDVSPLSGISGLSFDSTLLSLLLFFCLVLLPFLSYRFLPAGPFF